MLHLAAGAAHKRCATGQRKSSTATRACPWSRSNRVVQAAIQLDGMTATAQIQGQAVPPSVLPEPACGYIEERVELRDGIGQIEDLARRSEIKLGLPGGGNLVRLMRSHAAFGLWRTKGGRTRKRLSQILVGAV